MYLCNMSLIVERSPFPRAILIDARIGVISKPKFFLEKDDCWLSKNTQTMRFILKQPKGVIAISPYQLSEITTVPL